MMRVLAIVFVLLTIGVNVFALSGAFKVLGWSTTDWQPPFSVMGDFYTSLSAQIFDVANNMIANKFKIDLPEWSVHALVAYMACAAAIAASGMGITSREGFVDSVKSSGISVAWPFGVVFLMWKAVRMQIVTKFVKDHSLIFLGYLLAVVGVYFGAGYINNTYFM